MEIPIEVIAARNVLEDWLIPSGLVTGIDFGVENEDQPDTGNLALRIFVSDASNVPAEIHTALELFPFPVVIIQRSFAFTQLPDNDRYRPLVGGIAVASSRFLQRHTAYVGTLGTIVSDALDPAIRYGLSNFHVLCVDDLRASGDKIIQPIPRLALGGGERIGTLYDWSFPERTEFGLVDAAICTLEVDSLGAIAEIGPSSSTVEATCGMIVTKRGCTTGQTFGWISGLHGSYPLDYPQLPPIVNAAGITTTKRVFKNQIQIHADFPRTLSFGEQGDSGSVVLGPDNKVVGLYWSAGYSAPGDPMSYGLACHATDVESNLRIVF